MGADIEELEDGLVIRPSELHGANLVSYNDHRIVMSLTIAALGAKGKSEVTGTEVVKKSYADFFAHLRFLGAAVQLQF